MSAEVSVSRTGRGLETDEFTQAGGVREERMEKRAEIEIYIRFNYQVKFRQSFKMLYYATHMFNKSV